jgi:hypothetical protein
MSGGARNRVPGLVDGKSIYGDTTIEDTLTSIDETTELTQDELLHSILGELRLMNFHLALITGVPEIMVDDLDGKE